MDIQEKERIKEHIEKLKSSKFKQQTLPSWRPEPTTGSTMLIFSLFSLIFFGIGIVLWTKSQEIFEQYVDYSTTCGSKGKCQVAFQIEKNVQGPVFMYYELDNFYQNHRRYVKSRSDKQLRGQYLSAQQLTGCSPVQKVGDLWPSQRFNMEKTPAPLDVTAPAIPCGLVAKSFFNDTYSLINCSGGCKNGKKMTIRQGDIAWDSDVQMKFKNTEKDMPADKTWQEIQWMDMTDQHFIVWMRTAGLPNFRKLWGKIDGFKSGTYQVNIENHYNIDTKVGNKSIVFMTTNAFGGDNSFLAICFMALGVLNAIFVLVFLVLHFKS